MGTMLKPARSRTLPSRSKIISPVPDDIDINDIPQVDVTLLTLRKPTDLKKVIDSIPKPARAIPKNGLPKWSKLGLECKLPVPPVPPGKIVFSRGKIGEDIMRIGLGTDCPRPTFDLSDPYCNHITYTYDSMHDPHMIHHYMQKPARDRMKELGLCTKDNRAVCSLKQFNEYRKYLYIRFLDRIHMEMNILDERARDDLTLKNVEKEAQRQFVAFVKSEKAREMQEKHNRVHAEELAEKRRLQKEAEKKILARMQVLQEYKEKMRKERTAKAEEKVALLKQRLEAVAEMELRRKIVMVRQWRTNERRRLNKLKQEKEAKQARHDREAEEKWQLRVQSQNYKIQEEHFLLKLYQEDLAAGARSRMRKTEEYIYSTDLEFQRIKLTNWKHLHGGPKKTRALVKKMGIEFEKAKRGAKGMTREKAQKMAKAAMTTALSTPGDALMTLAAARQRMDIEVVLPMPPIQILDMLVEGAVVEFTRRRVHLLLKYVERDIRNRSAKIFFKEVRPSQARRSEGVPVSKSLSRALVAKAAPRGGSLCFGEVYKIAPQEFADREMKSARDRPPTPVPSLTRLAEVTFSDKKEDLPGPTTHAGSMIERSKLLEMVNATGRLLLRSVHAHVEKGMDLYLGTVTLPFIKRPMEMGEEVENLADAIVNSRVNVDAPEVRHTTLFLTNRILKHLNAQMKAKRAMMKQSIASTSTPDEQSQQQKAFYDPSANKGDFYVPGQDPTAEAAASDNAKADAGNPATLQIKKTK